MRRAYLTRVVVQTFWVVVDDETGRAEEMADVGVVVPASEWPDFYDRHSSEFAAIQAEVGKPG